MPITNQSNLTEEQQEAYRERMRSLFEIESGKEIKERSPRYSEYGICAKCAHFVCVESEFQIERARCSNHDIGCPFLNTNRPITRCTEFEAAGEMSLWDMQRIAWIIDPPKRKVGFITEP